MAALTCVDAVVRLQLVLEAEPLPAAVALVRLLARVDALVAPQGPVVSEAAPAVLALEGVVAWKQEPRQDGDRHLLKGQTITVAFLHVHGDNVSDVATVTRRWRRSGPSANS